MLAVEHAVLFSLVIVSFGLVISGFENLVNWNVFRSSGVLSWKISHSASAWLSKRAFLNFLFGDRVFVVFLSLSVIVSSALLIASCLGVISAFLLLLQLGMVILLSLRTFYGLDGAYHMNLVALFGSLLISVFGIESHIAVLCVWFVAAQLILSYFIAGARKLLSPVWRSGDSITLIFRTEAYGHRLMYLLAKKSKLVRVGLSWSVILWEVLFPLVLVLDMKWVACFLAVGALFHLMNAVFMGLNNFVFAFLAAYPMLWCALGDGQSMGYSLPVLAHLIVPLLLIAWLWNSCPSSLWIWTGKSMVVAVYLTNLVLTGFWPFYSFGHLGFGIILLFALIAIAKSLLSFKKREGAPEEKSLRLARLCGVGVLTLLAGVMAWESVAALRARIPNERIVELEFPLRNGAYYIVHGGNNASTNGHFGVRAQNGAIDVVKLNRAGVRASSLIPSGLDEYNIFGEQVYSPTDGVVVRVVDDSDSERPQLNPAGNHLVIKKEGTGESILLAHLLEGSIQVMEGDAVVTGQVLARVGNSGNTTEPHLHIHCVEENESGDYLYQAQPVSMIFRGAHLVRNSVYFAT